MDKNYIEINCLLPVADKSQALILSAAQTTLSYFQLTHKRIGIAIMNDEQIKQLNRDFREKDCATDVLSFAAREEITHSKQQESEYLGDIAISLPTAQRQALEYNQSLERELAFLTMHGTLHLLGYDHMTKEEEYEMRNYQRVILELL